MEEWMKVCNWDVHEVGADVCRRVSVVSVTAGEGGRGDAEVSGKRYTTPAQQFQRYVTKLRLAMGQALFYV